MWKKSFLSYFALKMILLNILQNFANYLLFCFAHYDNFSEWHISILQEKLKFLVLHNFTKCFLKIMFTKHLLGNGSSTSYVRTKITKIRPTSPCAQSYTFGFTPLYAYVPSIYSPLSLLLSLFSFLLVSEVKFH